MESVRVVPYDPVSGRTCFVGEPSRYCGAISEDHLSVYFTVAELIINSSSQYFPLCLKEHMRDEPIMNLYYYNPLVLKVLETLLTDKNTSWKKDDDGSLVCFYPVEKPLALGEQVAVESLKGKRENALIIVAGTAN